MHLNAIPNPTKNTRDGEGSVLMSFFILTIFVLFSHYEAFYALPYILITCNSDTNFYSNQDFLCVFLSENYRLPRT